MPSKNEIEQQKAAEIAHGVQMRLSLFPVERWEKAVRTQLVKKCGTRIYWDEWADDVAKIAQRHIKRISALIQDDAEVNEKFQIFLTGLRDSLNPGISEEDAVEMVAQHMITVPVFDALFGDFEFAKSNPVSVAIEGFLSILKEHQVEEASDVEILEDVYTSVRRRAAMVRTDTARQQLIRDLYERFFKVAFKDTSEKMGVVYTPSEIIEYILRETDRVLQREFGKSLADEGVHILDPFAGTGSFVAQLIESDLVPDDKLEQKYKHEMHSNEILLLAYYIMTINIEYAYHARMGGDYAPFEGAVLTDTFQMTEEGDTLDTRVFTQNSERVVKQNELPIRVIVGNPPYSVGQTSANDNNQNEAYPSLDRHIATTYAAKTQATNKNALYDSYIRAFRWASDRIGEQGLICFVSNAGWLRGAAMNGLRRCLVEEFDIIYVFDLRGNQRTQGEESRREGGKVFGSGSRTPVAITLLVRKANESHVGHIHYHDIGDYLTREDKLSIVRKAAISGVLEWQNINPDKYGDWLDQRDDAFYEFAPMGIENRIQKEPNGIFALYSRGFETDRDNWMYNYSKNSLALNISSLISMYGKELQRYSASDKSLKPKDFVTLNPEKISWSRTLLSKMQREKEIDFDNRLISNALYRPFCKQYVYASSDLADYPGQQFQLFPLVKGGVETTYQQESFRYLNNIAIACTGGNNPSCLITSLLPDLHFVGDAQCFPLYWYEEIGNLGGMFASDNKGYVRHEAITDQALEVFRKAYPHAFIGRYKKDGGEELNKEDIFYYIYGILHSSEYRKRFASNLQKELPRIPLAQDFGIFSKAGRALADLHLNYETVEPWPEIIEDGNSENPGRTEKMKFGKCKKSEDSPKGQDQSVLYVAENMTLRNIPVRAYDYMVNGKSAIGWLMDRYQVRTDKASSIVNDPNEYSDNPRYIVELVERVVTVSMETLDIVDSLPPLKEKPQPADWPFEWKMNQQV